MDSKNTKKKIKQFATGLILICIIYLAYAPLVQSISEKLLLIPKEEHFTELYFDNYPKLEAGDIVYGKKIVFSFVIHNLEGKQIDYPFKVYYKASNNVTYLIDAGKLNLVNNQSKIIEEFYTVTDLGQKGNIVVSLTDLKQEIFFSVPINN